MRSHYVFADRADQLAQELVAADVEWPEEPVAFALTVTEWLRSATSDFHFHMVSRELSPEEAAAPPEHRWKHTMPSVADNFGFQRAEVRGGVGLLVITALSALPSSAETAHAAMAFLRHAGAIVIDLRDCRGGDPDLLALLTSYLCIGTVELSGWTWRHDGVSERAFTDPSAVRFHFDPHVRVLLVCGPDTASGAEGFAYDLQALGRASVVGQRTLGAAHRISQFPIVDRFVLTVPSGKVTNPITGGDWEGTGVLPDIEVDRAEDARGVALELAKRSISGGEG